LHQSARDGYRSYLQAYASYSLKKIFDVNQLDLAKVGKSFGFAIPPRVNVSVGGGTGGAGRTGKKRRREEGAGEDGEGAVEVWEEIDAVDKEAGDENVDAVENEVVSRKDVRRNSKQRRTETLGKKRVDKEVYKKGLERKKMKGTGGAQWSR
jgi:ATP-dependent RNA helicase DDX18/HAS1